MKPVECEFEAEVLAAVVQSRWPERAGEQLRGHVAGCVICSDVAAIAATFDRAREETLAAVVVPDSGRVWWLAQVRARREAAASAAQPITAAQGIAFACAIALLGACFGAESSWFQAAFRWVARGVVEHGAVVGGSAAVISIVFAAAYLAMGREQRSVAPDSGQER